MTGRGRFAPWPDGSSSFRLPRGARRWWVGRSHAVSLSRQRGAARVSVIQFVCGADVGCDAGTDPCSQGLRGQAHRRFLRVTRFNEPGLLGPCLQGPDGAGDGGQEVRAIGQPMVCGGVSGHGAAQAVQVGSTPTRGSVSRRASSLWAGSLHRAGTGARRHPGRQLWFDRGCPPLVEASASIAGEWGTGCLFGLAAQVSRRPGPVEGQPSSSTEGHGPLQGMSTEWNRRGQPRTDRSPEWNQRGQPRTDRSPSGIDGGNPRETAHPSAIRRRMFRRVRSRGQTSGATPEWTSRGRIRRDGDHRAVLRTGSRGQPHGLVHPGFGFASAASELTSLVSGGDPQTSAATGTWCPRAVPGGQLRGVVQ